MSKIMIEKFCINCSQPLLKNPLPIKDKGHVCDFLCFNGWKNGEDLRKIIEKGEYWMRFFNQLEQVKVEKD